MFSKIKSFPLNKSERELAGNWDGECFKLEIKMKSMKLSQLQPFMLLVKQSQGEERLADE